MFASQMSNNYMEMSQKKSQNPQLNEFDFSPIEEMDPSVIGGYKILYDQELNFHIRFVEKDAENQEEFNSLEPLKLRLLIQGDINQPMEFRIEVSSENDIFFQYLHSCNQQSFEQIKINQNLNIDFNEYPKVCLKSFKRIEKDPQQFTAAFAISNDGMATLELIQITEYKNLSLMSLDFETVSEDLLRQQITFKYGSLKSKLALMEGRLEDISDLLKLKNPSLLLHLNKSSPIKKKK